MISDHRDQYVTAAADSAAVRSAVCRDAEEQPAEQTAGRRAESYRTQPAFQRGAHMRATTRFLCWPLAIVLAIAPALAADVTLVINRHGGFLVDTATNPPTVTPIPADRLVIDSEVGVPNPPPKDPDDPNPQPPTDQITQKIVDASKLHLKSEKEARSLMATIDLLRDLVEKGSLKAEQVDAALKVSLPVIAAQLNAGTRINDWYVAVKDATGDKLNADTMKKVTSALAFAWKIDAARAQLQMKAAAAKLASGQTVGDAAEAVTGTAEEAFDIGTILMIIQAILELLKSIGIIGG